MPNPDVTVAMPVYNGMPHVAAAIESVLNQTYDNLRLVVIDDGSTDGTSDYLATLDDPRIVLSPNPQNLGFEGAWNRALDQAEGSTYWKLLCADDLLFPHCVATEVAALEAHPDVVMTSSRRRIIDDDGRTLVKARGLGGMSGVVDGAAAIRRSIAMGTNLLGEPNAALVRSEAVLKAGRFDGSNKLWIDFDMWARVLQQGDLYAISEPLSAFRVGPISYSFKTEESHRALTAAEFRKIAESQPGLGIGRGLLAWGVLMGTGVAGARRAFHRVSSLRSARRGD